MFSKPFSLMLVYVVTVFNIMILFAPIVAVAIPFITIEGNMLSIENTVLDKFKFAAAMLMFVISFLMLLYLVFDFLFGFSVRASLKKCTPYEKIKDYDFLTDLFDQTKSKFGVRNVKLYIKNSDEINAYAVSSVSRRAVVLTRGIINHYLSQCEDPKDFLYALRSIIGHEMSHLVNKDFLPTFLIITNQKVTNFVSRAFHRFFNLVIIILDFAPYGGRYMSRVTYATYTALNFAITSFNRLVVYNLYEFLRRVISRSIEYRCDRQSAKAFGGQNMSFALSMLGKSGYFTLFSTHPATQKRMKKVENIKISGSIVKPGFFDSLANYFSLMFLVVICLYFAKQAQIDIFVRRYLRDHEAIHAKILSLWQSINMFF